MLEQEFCDGFGSRLDSSSLSRMRAFGLAGQVRKEKKDAGGRFHLLALVAGRRRILKMMGWRGRVGGRCMG